MLHANRSTAEEFNPSLAPFSIVDAAARILPSDARTTWAYAYLLEMNNLSCNSFTAILAADMKTGVEARIVARGAVLPANYPLTSSKFMI